MTVTDQIKILNRKIKQNEVQYDFDREAAKISALSSKNVDKYEYLTGEDLGLKSSTIEKAKFEYSPLGISLNRVFNKNEVESVTKNKSNFNYDCNYDFFKYYKGYDEFKEMSLDSKYNRMKEFNKLFLNFKSVKTKKKKQKHNLKKKRIMKNVEELYKNYYNAYKSDFDTDYVLAENKKKKLNYKQFELDDIITTKSDKLKWVKASGKRFNKILSIITEAKNNGLKANVDGEEITLDKAESLLKDISLKKMDRLEIKEKYSDFVEDVKKILNKQLVTTNEKDMIKMLSLLKEIIKPNDKKTPDEQQDTTNMPELESEESVKQRRNRQGKGLKILMPNQILSRLPISLAQLKAGNNSEKLKDEIRQLLYSLYRSKKLTKEIYKSLINIT